METRRLETLLALARLGSMRAVADAEGTTTSTVSQQVAALAREAGTALVEPEGRRVRLTPAGRRLAEHAVEILAAVEAARRDLDREAFAARPTGTVRVAGFASAIRRSVLPVVAELAVTHPEVRTVIHEYEPGEAHAALLADEVDLALTYDYDLAPAVLDPALRSRPLWRRRWGLAVPAGTGPVPGDSPAVLAALADRAWVANSRNRADEDVLRLLASLAGVEPRPTHEADSLDLVEDLVVAGLGVGLLPMDRPVGPGVRVLRLEAPAVWMRAVAVTRRGATTWPPLALVLDRVLAAWPPTAGGSDQSTA